MLSFTKAPFELMPAPFKVSWPVLVMVCPFKLNTAPVLTETAPDPRAVALPATTVPALILTPPLKPLPPKSVKALVPLFTRDPAPEIKSELVPELIVRLLPLAILIVPPFRVVIVELPLRVIEPPETVAAVSAPAETVPLEILEVSVPATVTLP